MADYSKEWCDHKYNGFPHDFSVVQKFAKLKDGESVEAICEGFGFTQIVNVEGQCHVVIKGELILFQKLTDR